MEEYQDYKVEGEKEVANKLIQKDPSYRVQKQTKQKKIVQNTNKCGKT